MSDPVAPGTEAVTETPAAGVPVAGEQVAAAAGATEAAAASTPAAPISLMDGEPEAEKPAEGEAPKEGEAEGEKPAGAPETYTDFTLPEGIEIAPEITTSLTTLAKEFNLDQASAQRLVDLGVQQAQGFQTALNAQVEAVQTEWQTQTKAEFKAEDLALAKKGRDAFGTPALTAFLNESGVGNHPEIVRLFNAVGKTVSGDVHITGDKAPAAAKDVAAKLYPNMKKGA